MLRVFRRIRAVRQGYSASYTPEGLGLSCRLESAPAIPIAAPLRSAIHAKVDIADWTGIAALMESARVRLSETGDGVRLHRRIWNEAFTYLEGDLDGEAEPDDIARRLRPLLDHHAANPREPIAAGMAASVLCRIGHAHRGCGWAHTVSDEGWRRFEEAARLADEAMDLAGEHWFLDETRLAIAQSQCIDREEAWRRYRVCVTADPFSASTYLTGMTLFLPRWYGSLDDMMRCARTAADRTQSLYGQMLYAACLCDVAWAGHTDELPIDLDRLQRGLDDWQARCPQSEAATHAANLAYDASDVGRFLEVVETADVLYEQTWAYQGSILATYAMEKTGLNSF